MKKKKRLKKLQLKRATIQQMDGASGGLTLWGCSAVGCGSENTCITDNCPTRTGCVSDDCPSVVYACPTYSLIGC